MSAVPSPYKNRMLESALWYATNMRWSVFPCHSIRGGRCTCSGGPNCKSPGKHPRWMRGSLEHGCASATTDEGIVGTWWTQWPGAHIGMATGAASGAWVLDEDPRHGGDGSRCALEQKHGKLPDTLQSVTGSKGSHRFFLHPGLKVKNEVAIAPGLDIRGDGGLVILPPSGHISGNTYEWDGLDGIKAPIANAPQWLLELVCVAPGARKPPQQIPEIIPDGTKHKTCVSLAGSMRWRGCNANEIYAALLKLSERFETPVPDNNLRDIADDVERRYGSDHATVEFQAEPSSKVESPDGLKPPIQPADYKETNVLRLPRICSNGRQLRDISNDALGALRAANDPPELFARSGMMVAIIRDEKHRQVVRGVEVDALCGRIARSADYFKVGRKDKDGNSGEYDCPPPLIVVRDILALAPERWGFPPLDAVTESPILRPDGSILDTPGYDPITRLCYTPDPDLRMPPIADEPSCDHINTALSRIKKTIGEFPYEDGDASYANTLAAMLTPIIKPAIDESAPMGLFDAPQAGTGKSLLCEVIAIIATGRAGKMFSAPLDEDEWRKVITTVLMSGTSVAIFDNITRPLQNADLCSVLTATTWADRAMKTHHEIALPVKAVFLASGNNIRLAGDMPRRCYRVRLDAKCSSPYLRTGPKPGTDFEIKNLKAWAIEHRGELLSALLTLARAWYVAGKPKPKVKPLGSFEAWTITVGGILEYAGVEGFMQNAAAMYEEADDEPREWEGFLHTLHEIFYGEPFTIAELIEKLNGKAWNQETRTAESSAHATALKAVLPGPLAEMMDREGSFQRRAGKAFAAKADRRFGESGVHLKRAGMSHGAQKWQIGGFDAKNGSLRGVQKKQTTRE
jgi:Bifunctional DNA primase/polymerase, N-terminal